MRIKAGVEFIGNPDEVVLVTPQTVYEAIPETEPLWRERFVNIVGTSMPAEFKKKSEIFGYALNAYAQKSLPQYFYDTVTFYQATQTFLIDGDLRAKDGPFDENYKAFFTVYATAIAMKETTNEADPCFQRYIKEPGHYSYFGYAPYAHIQSPFPAPCKQQFVPFEVEQRHPGVRLGQNNDAFFWRFSTGDTVTTCLGGGITADVDDIEVLEGGLIYVSLPDLPIGAPEPPPLRGMVVATGPPGPRGLQGVPGPPGVIDDESFVTTACGLNPDQKEAVAACLGIGDGELTEEELKGVFLAANPDTIKDIGQVLIEKAPEVMLPETTLTLEQGTTPELTAEAQAVRGWRLKLGLPLAVLLAMEFLSQTVQVYSCDKFGRAGVKNIPYPVLSFQGVTDRAMFQELFNQLSWLLKCCPPCQPMGWKLIGRFNGFQSFRFGRDFQAVRLVTAIAQPYLIDRQYGEMTLAYLGNLRWRMDDGAESHDTVQVPRLSPLVHWNSDDQEFHPLGLNVVGIEVAPRVDFDYFVWVLPIQKYENGISL